MSVSWCSHFGQWFDNEKRIISQRHASAGTICWGFSTWPPLGFSTLAIKERARTMNHGAETGSMTLLCFRACWCGVVAGGGVFWLAKIEPPGLELVRGGVFFFWFGQLVISH